MMLSVKDLIVGKKRRCFLTVRDDLHKALASKPCHADAPNQFGVAAQFWSESVGEASVDAV